MKKSRSLLFTVGFIIIIVFLIATYVNSTQIRKNYTGLELSRVQGETKQMTDYVRDELYAYEALPWLFSYWEKNHADMDIPVDGLLDEAWQSRHKRYIDFRVKSISSEEVAALPLEEQREFAEVCYLKCADFFDRLKREFDMTAIHCTAYTGDGESFVFFNGLLEDEDLKTYELGSRWAFNTDLHPVWKKIYETGEDISEIEHVISTTDGVDYMFVYSPVMVNGRLSAVVCEALNWSEIQNQIEHGAI